MDVTSILAGMSIEEKAGTIFMLAYASDRIEEAHLLIRDHHIGGCYLSRDNAGHPAEAFRVAAVLQGFSSGRLAGGAAGRELPLLLGVDQEGAWSPFAEESTTGPGNLALGAANDPDLTRRMYRILGREMSAVGYNTLLAPCVDVNSNPENPIIGMRSFGGRTAEVARHSEAAVKGAREGGVLATAKHFPGHGNTATDSHRGLPRVDRARSEIDAIDLPPFRAAVEAGVDIVMTSHILYPALDPVNPATLSPAILRDLLRTEMGFRGLILSDSMNMGAIRKNYRPEEAATQALMAGVDMIMLAEEHYDHDARRYLANQRSMIEAIVTLASSSAEAARRLDEAATRVLAARAVASERSSHRPPIESVGTAENRQAEREAAERALCVLKEPRGLLPVTRRANVAVITLSSRSAYSVLMSTRGIGPNQVEPAAEAFVRALKERLGSLHVQEVESLVEHSGPDSETRRADVVFALLEDYPLPGVSFDRSLLAGALPLLEGLAQKIVLVGFCDPYLAWRHAARFAGCLCACSSRQSSAEAAARAVAGEYRPAGKAPLDLDRG